MTFPQRLDHIAGLMDRRLGDIIARAFDDKGPHPAVPPRLVKALQHAALGGGKRFRPFLLIETAALFGVADEAALDAAAALECIHCYSLVHDDLPVMDNDELRRGQPTVWKAFDEWTAILAGDGLLTLAFDILSSPAAHPDAAVRVDLISGLAKAAGVAGMVGGQAFDLEAEKLGQSGAPTRAHIERLQSMKTGALIRYATEAGAILGRASAREREALSRFGHCIGFAFQVADDLLDAEGDAATVGKAVSKDAALGKATLVSIMGVDAARRELSRVEEEAIGVLDIFGAKAERLREAARFVARRTS